MPAVQDFTESPARRLQKALFRITCLEMRRPGDSAGALHRLCRRYGLVAAGLAELRARPNPTLVARLAAPLTDAYRRELLRQLALIEDELAALADDRRNDEMSGRSRRTAGRGVVAVPASPRGAAGLTVNGRAG